MTNTISRELKRVKAHLNDQGQAVVEYHYFGSDEPVIIKMTEDEAWKLSEVLAADGGFNIIISLAQNGLFRAVPADKLAIPFQGEPLAVPVALEYAP